MTKWMYRNGISYVNFRLGSSWGSHGDCGVSLDFCAPVVWLVECIGAIEYERHCSSTSNHIHNSAKGEMVYKH